MPNEYFFYQRKQSYIGYGKRTRGIREFALYSIIIAAGAIVTAAIILLILVFFFPKDKIMAFVSSEPSFYVNVGAGNFFGRPELVNDLEKYTGFDLILGEKEISFAGLDKGNLLITPKDNLLNFEEAAGKYFTEDRAGYVLVYSGGGEDSQNVFEKNFKDNLKARIFFGRPSFSFFTGFVDNEKFFGSLPDYLLPFKDNGAAKDFYFRAREKETRIVFNVTGGKKIGLSHEPLIKNIPERVLFLIRGFDVASYFSKWKNILPIKINDEDFDILSGKGELLVMAGEETRPPEFLLVIQKSLSEEEMARLESFIKKGIAEFLPREEKIILPDGEEAAELLADPASFGFSSDGAFKFLEARDDFQFAYGQIEKEGRSFLLFSNSLEHLKQFISFGDFSDNNLDQNITRDCFGRFFQENKVSLYLNPEFLMPYSGFLPNFSKILFNNVSDKVCILKYTPSPF